MFIPALTILLLSARSAFSVSCECGYTVNDNALFFTEALETDFLHVSDLTTDTNHTWIPQAYNVTPAAANGPYGKSSQVENVITNPVKGGHFDWTGPGTLAEDPGLQLWVRSEFLATGNSQMVPMAEIVSAREDILYGSFRIGMKTTSISGTCGAFFFYFNDTNEIDMEFLSKQNKNKTLNLVIQSPQSASLGYASGSDFDTRNLAFGSEEGYNEYRFDWTAGRVDFYANSVLLSSITENAPKAAGKLHISHWSNGNTGWSAGPPAEDSVLTVSYVKAYFNSSDSATTKQSLESCTAPQQICRVRDQRIASNPTGANGNQTERTTFLTTEGENATSDGEHKEGGGGRSAFPDAWWTAFLVEIVLSLLETNI